MRRELMVWMFVIFTASDALAAPGTPVYQSSDPSPNQMVHQPFGDVSVTFNELLDPTASDLSVSACGKDVDDEAVSVSGSTVEVGVVDNPVGVYTVSYSVTGADDTPDERQDPTEGTFEFFYHSKECGNDNDDDDNGHKGHDKDDKGGHDKKHGKKHGKKKHRGHPGGSGEHDGSMGHDASSHLDSTHTDHESEMHTDDHGSDDHMFGGHDKKKHKKGHGGHGGKDKNTETHHEKGAGTGGSADRRAKEGPSRPNEWVNLSLVLLLPAALGALGGRRLRRLGLTPAS